MGHPHLDRLGQVLNGEVGQVGKKEQVLEDGLVGLFLEVAFETFGDLLDETVLFFDVELLLDLVGLLYIVRYPQEELVRNVMLLGQSHKRLIMFALLLVLVSDVLDQRPHAVDVVRQHQATDRLNED